MTELIRISALGRDARVGDFYDYFTGLILSSGVEVPKASKNISETENKTEFSFFYQQPEKFKRHMLSINSHLYNSIEKGYVDSKKLWFANYLNANSTEGGVISEAEVTVFIRVTRRTETLDPNFFLPKMFEYQQKSGERATHLLEKVVYGAEIICSIRKFVDQPRETKENVERSLYLAAQDYFHQVVNQNSAITQIPLELLDKVNCTVLDSLEAGNELKGSFEQFSYHLIDVINFNKNEELKKWKPIEIVLRDIKAIEIRLWFDRKSDIEFLKEQHEVTWKLIVEESRNLSSHTSLNRFPPLEKVICQFKDLLQPFWTEIQNSHHDGDHGRTPVEVLKEMKSISEILTKMTEWLAQRQKEIEEFGLLLNGTHLGALDLEDIKTQMKEAVEKFAKVFVLNVNYCPNVLVEDIQKKIRDPSYFPIFELPTLMITRLEKERLAEVRKQLHAFATEAALMRGNPTRETCYHIALVPSSSSWYDGTIKVLDFSDRVSEQCLVTSAGRTDSLQNFEQSQRKIRPSIYPKLAPLTLNDDFTSIVENGSSRMEKTETNPSTEKGDLNEIITHIHPSHGIETTRTGNKTPGQDSLVENLIQLFEMKDESVASFIQKSVAVARNQEDEKLSGDHEQNKTKHSNSSCREEETRQNYETHTEASETNTRKNNGVQGREYEAMRYDNLSNNQKPDVQKKPPPSNQNIAEMFTTNKQYSQLIKKGHPNIFLLKAQESSTSNDFRCFDMGQPEGSMPSYGMRNHKVIILMGATGCGKSSLINGMINYILGVRWNDPFRFKCVREDETTTKNQAHSQTSSVTAYTLRHHEGMAVPYSITIIDTPGYRDTREVKKDKEITSKIRRFFTQSETRVDEIHAACFVAASGDSRLTATQRYVIDSVLSIFGKDVKENFRLLVTFADNAYPPVVEVCLAANFPFTSASAGITFSKFNSSVLYANNQQHGDDDFSFDELFWDMGQENFQKFFTMLEGMNGKDLKSTRNVIQSRKLLEQSLENIEQELEVCFVKIENMEMFHRKMKEYGHKMETNRNFTFEKTKMRLTKLECNEGFFAYNCHRCRNTCERPIKQKKEERLQNIKRKCDKKLCVCPASEHEFQPFQWRMTPVKITTTLKDMKAEYESNYDDKITVEQLLANCSDDLNVAKVKVFSLLDQVGENIRLLESTTLRSNALTPSDYISLMRSRVAEEQAPGYLTRLETLTELQNCLAASASASASHMNVRSIPNKNKVHQSFKTGGVHQGGNFGAADRSRSNKFPQHSTTDNRMTSTKSGSAAYYNFSNTRTTSYNNNQLARHQGTTNYVSPANQKPSYGSDSKEGCSSDDKEKETKTGAVFASFAPAVAKAAASSVKVNQSFQTGEASRREPLVQRGGRYVNEFSQHSLRESGTFSMNSKESACASSVFNNARASSSSRSGPNTLSTVNQQTPQHGDQLRNNRGNNIRLGTVHSDSTTSINSFRDEIKSKKFNMKYFF